jgi:glutathione reductase (NADPH)
MSRGYRPHFSLAHNPCIFNVPFPKQQRMQWYLYSMTTAYCMLTVSSTLASTYVGSSRSQVAAATTTLVRRRQSSTTSTATATTADVLRSLASLVHRRSQLQRDYQRRTFRYKNTKTVTTAITMISKYDANCNHSNATNTRAAASSTSTTTASATPFDYDFLVIGAGSGGIAAARRAASYGAKVAVAEQNVMGGTCVNVGCVPKKIMWNAASIAESIHDMEHYGFAGLEHVTLDWSYLKRARDMYIRKLNILYDRNLATSGVTRLLGVTASLTGPHSVLITPTKHSDNEQPAAKIVTAQHILIATGGKPIVPPGDGIAKHAITSDGFFELSHLPRRAVVVGGGYIAVEMAGILQALGTETKLVVRQGKALRTFDDLLSDTLDEEMQRQGIQMYRHTNGIRSIELLEDDAHASAKIVHLHNGESIVGVDTVIVATGRRPNVDSLNLTAVGVVQRPNDNGNDNGNENCGGYIAVDEYARTSVESIFAIGDVVGHVELTPTAIATGRRLADRLFGGDHLAHAKVSLDLVPTVVFSHPTIGTIGLSEQAAIQKYGEANIKVYKAKFSNLYYGPWQVDADSKPKTAMKLVCAGQDELIVGLHVIGMGAAEMLQGFGVALRMGATKADFDATMAIHPTAAEELVTLFPWGLSPPESGSRHATLYGAPAPKPKL